MRRSILAVAGIAVLATTSACGGGEPEETADGLTPVTVGAIPIVDVAPLYLAVDQGFFEDQGLDVTIESTTGGAQAVPNVVNGTYDFAFGNIASLITARDQNLPVVAVANGVTTTGEQGNDFGAVVVPEGSAIEAPADLAGATVAVNNLRNIGDTTVRNSVRLDGGDPSGIEFVELAFPDMPAALAAGDVDAAWVVEPFLTTSLDDGATEIASNFVDAHERLSIASYFTTEQVLAEDPELVDSFTAAMRDALAYADSRPEEVRRILGTYTEIDAAVIEEIRLPAYPAETDRDSVQAIADLMVEDGAVDNEPDIGALLRETR
ncbi:ABC transporter substrate-binding protein [Nocardiopsis mangrovi]|uniref:ABC transporter substrate-binding protein n=1 Tax=Nocardiopsis mangrovi TaxID=1179818 RepID=A0ABV9DQI8_9ACTN